MDAWLLSEQARNPETAARQIRFDAIRWAYLDIDGCPAALFLGDILMRDSGDARKITLALWHVMQKGRRTVGRTENAMGVTTDTLRGARNYGGLRLRHVTDAIEALGIPPAVFFNDVFGGVSTTATERFVARGAELATRKLVELPKLVDDTKLDRLTEDDLARLDAARFEDSRAAAEQAAGIARLAARDGRRGDAAAAVARQGSALRVAEEWEPAWVCVWWALQHAPDGPIKANAWLRSGSIVSDFGEFDDAAELAHSAMVASAECADFTGIGPALANRGMFLRRAEKAEEAIPILKAALATFSETEALSRFSVFQDLALAALSMGRPEESEAYADKAQSTGNVPDSFVAHLCWLRARIAAQRGSLRQSIHLYQDVIPALRDSPTNTALASAELCHVHLKAGLAMEAIAVAIGMARLAVLKSQNPIVAAVIMDLYRSARAGTLSIELTNRVVKRIRKGIRQRAGG